MQGYLSRLIEKDITERLTQVPVVALIGPRQCGKSTLVRHLLESRPDSLYLDLEKPSDHNKLRDPEAFFSMNQDKLICLDEIQRREDLFPVLRGIVDINNRNGQLLILGSASPYLLRQSSETLAGRISYLELTPFLWKEVDQGHNLDVMRKLWLYGGYPRSYLTANDHESFIWRQDFIRTFLEREIPAFGFRVPVKNIERFWMMCAHVNGQVLNYSQLAGSLSVTSHTIRSYMDILEQTYILRIVKPYTGNMKKRLIKAPKLYLRDTGILHALLSIETQNDLLGHPSYGSSWEAFCLENILAYIPYWKISFYRTSAGAEIDLILEKGNKLLTVECKASTAPVPSRGFWNGLDDLKPMAAWVVSPVKESYLLERHVRVGSPGHFINYICSL